MLKTENEEKSEIRDLAKFVTQLTQGFFSETENILLAMELNTELREALAMLDQSACSLQALCSFEYRIERQGEHQGRLLLNKQTQSKSFILNQDIKESAIAVDFKLLAYGIAEKSLTFFVSKQMYALKEKMADKLMTAFLSEVRRIDASDCSKTIYEYVAQTILAASPSSHKIGGVDSIFEEEPDLVALLV